MHRFNWRDFVEVVSEKKYYLISQDAEKIGEDTLKYLNYEKAYHSMYFGSSISENGWQTQFTQAQIDELANKVSGLRKEEVK